MCKLSAWLVRLCGLDWYASVEVRRALLLTHGHRFGEGDFVCPIFESGISMIIALPALYGLLSSHTSLTNCVVTSGTCSAWCVHLLGIIWMPYLSCTCTA